MAISGFDEISEIAAAGVHVPFGWIRIRARNVSRFGVCVVCTCQTIVIRSKLDCNLASPNCTYGSCVIVLLACAGPIGVALHVVGLLTLVVGLLAALVVGLLIALVGLFVALVVALLVVALQKSQVC